MSERIRALLDREARGIESLHTRLAGASDEAEATGILREIGQLKQSTELGILQLQLEFAPPNRDAEETGRLERAIEALVARGAITPTEESPKDRVNSEEVEP